MIIKNATFHTSKKNLGPVHLHPKTDKWDYLRSPIMKKKFVSCFDIGKVPGSPGKWNWNWLYFLPFIFTFEQGVTCLDYYYYYRAFSAIFNVVFYPMNGLCSQFIEMK